MKKNLLALTLAGTILSCSMHNDDAQCVKVHYLTEYCAEKKSLHLVRFLKPSTLATPMSDHDSTIYLAAIIDLPKGVQKVDTTFYMYFHYDKELAKSRKPNICQAMFSSVNILVCDMVTNEPCKTTF